MVWSQTLRRKFTLLVSFSFLAGLSAAAEALTPMNVVVNSSFELGPRFSGTPMRRHLDPNEAYLASPGAKTWSPINTEGWLVDGPDPSGVEATRAQAHSGQNSLRIAPPSNAERAVFSDFNNAVPAGPVTLSAWVKTQGAKGRLSLNLVPGWQQVQGHAPSAQAGINLPADADWTRLSVTVDSPSRLAAFCRLSVTSGVVFLDDVQIEAGSAPTAFNVRSEEWLRLSIPGCDDAQLARYRADDQAPRRLSVINDSRLPLTGTVTAQTGPWNAPKQQTVAIFKAKTLLPGAAKTFLLPALTVPEAYVATLSLTDAGTTLVDGAEHFFPSQPSGGEQSNGMVSARTAIRYAVTPATPPAQLFGIGNGMLQLGDGNYSSGYTLSDFAEARPLALTSSRGHYSDDIAYLTAAAGITSHVTYIDDTIGPFGRIDELVGPSNPAAANPAQEGLIDIFSPAGSALLRARADAVGRKFAADPSVASFQMSNEAPFLNVGSLCPSASADAAFRAWCKARYGTLNGVNSHWKTSYTDWSQVEQIVSAHFLNEVKNEPKRVGAAAIDWTAATGRMSPEIIQRMVDNPGRAMDWMRWRTASSLQMYAGFRARAKQFDRKTLYSTNLCWPDFWPQMFMPFVRAMDVTMLDNQYTSGLPKALGSPFEMMDGMEMAESADPSKPIWGIETYVQPQWPPEFVALQNWGLLAHGMTNNLVFGWKPYSDAGPVKEARAWEKPDAPAMWMLIDKDGTKLPVYYTYVRSLKEISDYHKRFDGFSIKRAPTDTALYVSNDTNEYVVMSTGNQPWGSPYQRVRNNVTYLLRMSGIAADYVDDATLPAAPGRFEKIIVPAACVLSQPAAEKLAAFAKAGGTIVLAGPCGLRDPWLTPYSSIGGPAWADLGWAAPASSLIPDQIPASFAPNAAAAPGVSFRGIGLSALPNGTPILDAAGRTVGWQRSWGQGKLIAYSVFPDTDAQNPQLSANLFGWTKQLAQLAHLDAAGRWVSAATLTGTGIVGAGEPVVEVVVRQKSATDRFVFCLNQGGDGQGTLEVPVSGGKWQVTDALTDKPMDGVLSAGVWHCALPLPALGYRVLHLTHAPANNLKKQTP